MGHRPNDAGMSRLHIKQQIEGSLKRLQTDYVDVYYIHHVDHQTPLEEMLRALDDLVRQGKILYTACSNYEAWRLMEALWLSDSNGWERFAAYQPQYNLVVRDIDEEIVPACELKGLGVVAWSPLAGGYLAGKYTPGSLKVQGTRSSEGWGFNSRFFAANHGDILQTLLDTAKELGTSPAQVALRWVIDQPFMTSAIVGARNAEQLEETLKVGGWKLPATSFDKLSKVSTQPFKYPRAFEDPMRERRDSAVKMIIDDVVAARSSRPAGPNTSLQRLACRSGDCSPRSILLLAVGVRASPCCADVLGRVVSLIDSLLSERRVQRVRAFRLMEHAADPRS